MEFSSSANLALHTSTALTRKTFWKEINDENGQPSASDEYDGKTCSHEGETFDRLLAKCYKSVFLFALSLGII